MNSVAGFLDVPGLDSTVFAEDLKDQQGKTWKSNSSHMETVRITDASVRHPSSRARTAGEPIYRGVLFA